MKKEKQTVIIVTAYGEDNYYQKRYEDIVGIYTSVKEAMKGAIADGLTNRQMDGFTNINAPYFLDLAMRQHRAGITYQADYEEETDKRRKPCVSSYLFTTFNLDS